MTWARAYLKDGELWMDIGRGEVVKLPPTVRDAWWEGTTRQWPFMAADLGIARDTLMAHYLRNHVAVAYGDIFDEMVALSRTLGFRVRVLAASASLNVPDRFYLGIDVGTGSARAGLFDGAGAMLAAADHPIQMWHDGGRLRRAIVGRHLARLRRRGPAGAARREAWRPRACAASASTPPARWSRSTTPTGRSR